MNKMSDKLLAYMDSGKCPTGKNTKGAMGSQRTRLLEQK